jgi:hypothetical protein
MGRVERKRVRQVRFRRRGGGRTGTAENGAPICGFQLLDEATGGLVQGDRTGLGIHANLLMPELGGHDVLDNGALQRGGLQRSGAE